MWKRVNNFQQGDKNRPQATRIPFAGIGGFQ